MNITFDTKKLEEIMNSFYTLTKIRIVMFDDDFNKIMSAPSDDSGFCGKLKKNKEFNALCEACDENARFVCRNTDAIHTYICHAGLIESITPLKMNGIILGYIMLGQVMDKSEKKKKKTAILEYAKNYSECDMNAEYDKLAAKSKKQIEAAVNLMEVCACYLWAQRLVRVNEDCLAALISTYISKNLIADLSVDTLCSHFRISRNKLYKISRESYGTGIAAYIRKQRINNAAQLLKSGSTVADAAINSGFYDYNYFSEIFKKEMGILPSKYARWQ